MIDRRAIIDSTKNHHWRRKRKKKNHPHHRPHIYMLSLILLWIHLHNEREHGSILRSSMKSFVLYLAYMLEHKTKPQPSLYAWVHILICIYMSYSCRGGIQIVQSSRKKIVHCAAAASKRILTIWYAFAQKPSNNIWSFSIILFYTQMEMCWGFYFNRIYNYLFHIHFNVCKSF